MEEQSSDEANERMAKKKVAENDKRWAAAGKAFQTVWVAGTVGAYFSALTRSLPVHFRERTLTPDWPYTIDRFLRYGYVVWLLAYFITSNVLNQREPNPQATRPKRQFDIPLDIPFDVIQSFCALIAMFALGFTVADAGFPYPSFRLAYAFANGAIFVICLAALRWFRSVPPTEVNVYRVVGLIVSLASIGLSFARFQDATALTLFGLSEAVLWAMLISYSWMRLRVQPSEEGTL
jgi:hypothetical protein